MLPPEPVESAGPPWGTSDAGLAFLEKEEGCVLHEYLDQLGLRTIGVGHLLGPNEQYPQGITQDEARAILRKDLAIREGFVRDCVGTTLQSQGAWDALVSLVFNVGTTPLYQTLGERLKAKAWEDAGRQILRWRKGGGAVLPVLVGRRKREAALFLGRPVTAADYAAVGLLPSGY